MKKAKRPFAYWILVSLTVMAIALMLVGQTTSIFDYDFTVRNGLQESEAQVGEYGVQINRAFGAGDTIIYVPILLASLIGLWRKKAWSLVAAGAAAGISLYWSVTVSFIFLFLPGTVGYNNVPGLDIWFFVLSFTVFGLWSLLYVIFMGEKLIR